MAASKMLLTIKVDSRIINFAYYLLWPLNICLTALGFKPVFPKWVIDMAVKVGK